MSELRRQMKMRREREKNRKREEENVGSLASFGSRCVTSPLPRQRLAAASVRISRSWVQTPGVSDVRSVHRAL